MHEGAVARHRGMGDLAAAGDRAIDQAAEFALGNDLAICPFVTALKPIAERACGGDGLLGVRWRRLLGVPDGCDTQRFHGGRDLEDAIAKIVQARMTPERVKSLPNREQLAAGGDIVSALQRAGDHREPVATPVEKSRQFGRRVSGRGTFQLHRVIAGLGTPARL